MKTYTPAAICGKPLVFAGIVMAFAAALALLLVPPLSAPALAPGPVELRAGPPAQK